MKTLKFKSNINCTGCLSKVTPVLNEEKAIEKWDVDLESDDRILTVETSNLDAEKKTLPPPLKRGSSRGIKSPNRLGSPEIRWAFFKADWFVKTQRAKSLHRFQNG